MAKQTALHAYHAEHAKSMGEFAGYEMPFYYEAGVLSEHNAVRNKLGLFDVSHMGQIQLSGKGCAAFLETITPSAFTKAKQAVSKYTVLTNAQGGIIDDLIVTRLCDDVFFAVINAGCKDKDIAWIKENLPTDITLEVFDDRALIAVQGPEAEAALSSCIGDDLSALGYMRMAKYDDLWVSRLGYTGEDGFEVSVPADDALPLWQKLIDEQGALPCGLAARDSLRLEMGYPLYGHDIDATTSPIEADIAWVVRKQDADYIGGQVIASHRELGVLRKRVGVSLVDKGIAREGVKILNAAGDEIGALTSGGHSPSLNKAIAMGYVLSDYSAADTEIFLDVRGRKLKATIAPLPFVSAKTKSNKPNTGKAA
jgi:aminomethyltransferase